MKNYIKFLGIIVFAAVIGFSMVACNLFGGKEEEQETQKTNTQTPGTDPNHDHVWGDWSVTTAATCSATGVETRTCALDSSHTETRDIAINPNAHNWIAKGTPSLAPTCETTGIGAKVCTLNASHEDNDPNSVIPALGHNYNWQQTTAPTCTAAGIETGTCTHDASHTTTRSVAALGHDFGNWTQTTVVTVTTDGSETRTCTRDSHTETRTAYATGTAGLAYELITSGTNANTYRVRKGTVTTGTVHIPAYHRPDANSSYLPVTEIGASNDSSTVAFNSSSITAVTFAENSQLKSIGQYAFIDCTGLTSITIPTSVTSISYGAFENTGLTSITIPASVTSIASRALSGCTGLTSITVDTNNPNYSSENGILYNKAKTTLIQAPGAISGTVTIPASVTSIGFRAFYRCTSLTSIIIPVSVTSIGQEAFRSCYSLTSVTIPVSVTSIGNYAFSYCTSLTSITIPAGVTSIGYGAFSDCTSLTSVTFAGAIASSRFDTDNPFPGDLRTKFYATDSANGTPGTYTATGTGDNKVWTRQP